MKWSRLCAPVKTGNRDALLYYLTDGNSNNELLSLSMKDGFQAMMTLFVCKPHNCCQYYGRFELIKEVLYQNKLDISVGPELSSIVQCPDMKRLLEDWIETPPEKWIPNVKEEKAEPWSQTSWLP